MYDEVSRETFQPGGGCSRIWGPNGESLGNTLGLEEEGLVIADLDFDLIEGAKTGADPVGHYSRPDVFQLHINRTPPRHAVEYWHREKPVDQSNADHHFNGIPSTPVRNLLATVEVTQAEQISDSSHADGPVREQS